MVSTDSNSSKEKKIVNAAKKNAGFEKERISVKQTKVILDEFLFIVICSAKLLLEGIHLNHLTFLDFKN